MTKDWQAAVTAGDISRVVHLLNAGADVNALDRYGQTALMSASHKGYVDVVRLLVERGANLNHTAKHGLSSVMLAVIGGHPKVVRVLVDAGADLSRLGTGMGYQKTALQIARAMKRTECAEIIAASSLQ